MALLAKGQITIIDQQDGKSSYTHIRYSNDGKNFTAASAEALDKAADYPIEGRNIFVARNVLTKTYIGRNIVNQTENLGVFSPIIKQHTDKRYMRISARVEFIDCTFAENSMLQFQGNSKTYGWGPALRLHKATGYTLTNGVFDISGVVDATNGTTPRYQASTGMMIRIDYITGTIKVSNVKYEFVDGPTSLGTPYSPAPEDAAIGTTAGRWRGEMVSDSPIASVNFSDYTWTKAANDTIYLRGTGMNRNANGIVRINGVDIVNGWWSGLRMLTFDRNTLEKKSDWIAVYANFSDWSTLANKLNALDDSVFVALVSCDALSFNPNVVNALQAFGAKELPPTFSARVPFVFFSYRGAPEALSMVSGTAATDPYAEVSTYMAERTFIIGKKGDKGTDGNDGVSITSTKMQYNLSTSKTIPNGNWSDTPLEWEFGKYLWTRLCITYSVGSPTYTPAALDSAWESIAMTEMGGRNFFGFRKGVQLEALSNVEIAFVASLNGIRIRVHSDITNPSNPILVRVRNLGFERAGNYTASFRVRTNRTLAADALNVNICDAGLKSFTPSATEQHIVTTANVTNYYQTNTYNGFIDFELSSGHSLKTGDVIEISDLMIERGRIPSDYKMAEEDATYMQRLLEDTLKLEEVTIKSEKGVSFAGMYCACERLPDGQQVPRSFLNGLTTGVRPAFAAGVENFDTNYERYATAFYHNGSGHLGGLHFNKSKETSKPIIYIADQNGVERVNFSGETMPTIEQLASRATEVGTIPVTTLSVSAQNDTGYFDAAQATASPSFRTKRATGTLRCRFRLTKSGTNHAPCTLTLVLRRKGDHYRQYVMTLGQITAGVTTSEFNIDKLVNLAPEEEYDLALVLSGFDAFNATGTLTMLSPLTYTQTNQDPFVGIFADGLMAYHSPQQWTRVQNGVVESSNDNPIVLASGYVDKDGNLQRGKGRVVKAERRSTGEYLIHHTIGHTDYAIIISPIGNGDLLVGQLAASSNNLAWCYIKNIERKNVNGVSTMTNSAFTFAILGRQ